MRSMGPTCPICRHSLTGLFQVRVLVGELKAGCGKATRRVNTRRGRPWERRVRGLAGNLPQCARNLGSVRSAGEVHFSGSVRCRCPLRCWCTEPCARPVGSIGLGSVFGLLFGDNRLSGRVGARLIPLGRLMPLPTPPLHAPRSGPFLPGTRPLFSCLWRPRPWYVPGPRFDWFVRIPTTGRSRHHRDSFDVNGCCASTCLQLSDPNVHRRQGKFLGPAGRPPAWNATGSRPTWGWGPRTRDQDRLGKPPKT
jgi:hypothetical protein